MNPILSFLLTWLLAAVVIFIVGKIGLGMTVDGFVPALIAAAVIAVISAIVFWLLGLIGIDMTTNAGLFSALIALVVAAVILMISDRFVSGMHVGGFVPAIVAAIAIAVVAWLANWVLSLF